MGTSSPIFPSSQFVVLKTTVFCAFSLFSRLLFCTISTFSFSLYNAVLIFVVCKYTETALARRSLLLQFSVVARDVKLKLTISRVKIFVIVSYKQNKP